MILLHLPKEDKVVLFGTIWRPAISIGCYGVRARFVPFIVLPGMLGFPMASPTPLAPVLRLSRSRRSMRSGLGHGGRLRRMWLRKSMVAVRFVCLLAVRVTETFCSSLRTSFLTVTVDEHSSLPLSCGIPEYHRWIRVTLRSIRRLGGNISLRFGELDAFYSCPRFKLTRVPRSAQIRTTVHARNV